MAKALSITGMVVSICLLLIFGLDLAIQIPFGKMSTAMDVGFLICAGLLAFMSWTTYRELP